MLTFPVSVRGSSCGLEPCLQSANLSLTFPLRQLFGEWGLETDEEYAVSFSQFPVLPYAPAFPKAAASKAPLRR